MCTQSWASDRVGADYRYPEAVSDAAEYKFNVSCWTSGAGFLIADAIRLVRQ